MKILKTLLLLLGLGVAFPIQAQIVIGFRGGINIANQSYDIEGLDIAPDPITGINAALLVEIGIAERLALQPEVNFIQKGVEFPKGIFGAISGGTTHRFNQLDLQFLGKLKLGAEKLKGHFLAGPYAGYTLSGTVDQEGEKSDFDFDLRQYRRTEFGMAFGAGLGFEAGPGTFFADGRYLLGLTDLNDANDVVELKIKNTGIAVGVGYLVPLSGARD